MDLELFTVLYKENGAIGIEFNPDLLEIAPEEELINEMTDGMDAIAPIVNKLMMYLQGKNEEDED